MTTLIWGDGFSTTFVKCGAGAITRMWLVGKLSGFWRSGNRALLNGLIFSTYHKAHRALLIMQCGCGIIGNFLSKIGRQFKSRENTKGLKSGAVRCSAVRC